MLAGPTDSDLGLALDLALHLLGRHFLLSHRGDVDVGVVVHLVALPQVLDDVEVVAGGFCQTFLKNPALRLRVRVPQPDDILHGCLQVPDSGQNQQLEAKVQLSEISCKSNGLYCCRIDQRSVM